MLMSGLRIYDLGVIGARLGVKRPLEQAGVGSQTLDHGHDYVVGPNVYPVLINLGRQMSVAEMPCDLHQFAGLGASYLDHRFLGRSNHYPAAILAAETIAVGHRHGVRKVEHNMTARRGRQAATTSVTVVEGKSD